MEMNFASNGKANTGIALGASALGVSALNAVGGKGLLGGILGGGCNEREMELRAQIARLEGDVKLRDANIFSDSKDLAVYKYFAGEVKEIRDALCKQAIHNQKTEDSFILARQDIASVEARLADKIKLESERRCCADNAIVNYANATFYPKLVADVTAGSTTTAQTLYNPIPACDCDCK